ncbi:glycosyltransferase [Leucobacter zeae]|nr:glycosyltransferase [Leucobacter zeae]
MTVDANPKPGAGSPRGRALVLVTARFPYGVGEEFLEAELPEIAARFAEVWIIPTAAPTGAAPTRTVPANVHVVRVASPLRQGASTADTLRLMARHPFATAAAAWRSRSALPGASRFLESLRFDLVTGRLAASAAPALGALRGSDGSVVFYSYWLHTQARTAIALRARLGLRSAPIISRAHGGDLYDERSPSGRFPQRELVLGSLDRIHPVSEHGAQTLATRHPAIAARVSVRRLGVSGATAQRNQSRAPFRVLSVSWIKPVKRLHVLVAALADLQRRGVDARWTHVGGGDAAAERELRALAEQRLTAGTAEFTGALPNPQLRALLDDRPQSVFVNVSASEGVPVTIMEALAQGLPVVATAVGGTRELFSERMFDGLIEVGASESAEPKSEAELAVEVADRLEALARATDAEYARYADASLAEWRHHWSADTNYAAFAEELRDRAQGGTAAADRG